MTDMIAIGWLSLLSLRQSSTPIAHLAVTLRPATELTSNALVAARSAKRPFGPTIPLVGLLDWRCLEVNANFLEVKTARRPL